VRNAAHRLAHDWTEGGADSRQSTSSALKTRARRTVDSAAGVVARVTPDDAVGEVFAGRDGPLMLATESLLLGSGAASGATLAEILAIIWLSLPSLGPALTPLPMDAVGEEGGRLGDERSGTTTVEAGLSA
jgi:hypothetical protein